MAPSNKLLSALGKVNDLVEWAAVNLTWFLLFAITVLNIVQVFYRYVLNDALSWTEEASLWMMVWITFCILPVAYRKGLNISMMLFRNMLKRNRIEYLIRCFFHLMVLVIAGVCLYQAWLMYKGGHRLELPALEISKAWVYIIMPPTWVLLMLAVIEAFSNDFMGILNPAAAQAAEDAKSADASGGGKS